MKRIKLHIINGKRKGSSFKYIMLGVMSCMLIGSIFGCGNGRREDYLAEENKSDTEQADELMQSILDALEMKDAEALKGLFSVYALDNADDLDGKIEELINFYPGSNGGYEGNIDTHDTTNYGETIYVLNAVYTITNDDESYQMCITTHLENDKDSDKIGLYLIEVMTEETMSDDFKWKDEEDDPGIYVLE